MMEINYIALSVVALIVVLIFIIVIADIVKEIKMAPVYKMRKENERRWLEYYEKTNFIMVEANEDFKKGDLLLFYNGLAVMVKDGKDARKTYEEVEYLLRNVKNKEVK